MQPISDPRRFFDWVNSLTEVNIRGALSRPSKPLTDEMAEIDKWDGRRITGALVWDATSNADIDTAKQVAELLGRKGVPLDRIKSTLIDWKWADVLSQLRLFAVMNGFHYKHVLRRLIQATKSAPIARPLEDWLEQP